MQARPMSKPEIVLLRFGRHIALSRWRTRPLNTVSGFAFVDIAAFKRSESMSKPDSVLTRDKNFIQLSLLDPSWATAPKLHWIDHTRLTGLGLVELFDVAYYVTLTTQHYSNWYRSKAWVCFPIRSL